MDMNRKVELAVQSIRSISLHDDEDMQMRTAALNKVAAAIEAEKAAMAKRVEERVAALLK